MTSRVSRSTLAVVLALLALATPVVAQIRVDLGGTVGRYSPEGSFQPASVYSTQLPLTPDELSGLALGGQLRLWVGRVGVQLAATTTAVREGGGNTPGGYKAPTAARVSTGSAQLLFRLTGDGGRARAWLGARRRRDSTRRGGVQAVRFTGQLRRSDRRGVGDSYHRGAERGSWSHHDDLRPERSRHGGNEPRHIGARQAGGLAAAHGAELQLALGDIEERIAEGLSEEGE